MDTTEIEDPVQEAMHEAVMLAVETVMRAHCKKHGLTYPHGVSGWAHLRFKLDNGEKFLRRCEWL